MAIASKGVTDLRVMSTSTPSLWTPSFDVYQGRIGDRLALFSVDLIAADHAPVEGRGTRVQVTASRVDPQVRRSPSDEVDAIYALEDVLLPIAAKVGALYVGRHSMNGETSFNFYVTDEDTSFTTLLEGVSSKAFNISVRSDRDPAWGYYFEFLLPDAYEYQSMMNRHLLSTMRQCGDKLTLARPVDHGALFPKRSLALAASKSLEALGYRVSEPARHTASEDSGRDELPWLITFFREEPEISEAAADKFCFAILDVVLSFSGEYDGWGSPVQGDHDEETWYDEAVGS